MRIFILMYSGIDLWADRRYSTATNEMNETYVSQLP